MGNGVLLFWNDGNKLVSILVRLLHEFSSHLLFLFQIMIVFIIFKRYDRIRVWLAYELPQNHPRYKLERDGSFQTYIPF